MKLKVGFVGLQHGHSKGHFRELELMDDVESIHVVGEDEAAVAEIRSRPKVAAASTNLDDLLRRDDVPVVLVMKRNDESVPTMLRVVESGKHVVADKPAARTADEMARLVDAANRRNLIVGVYYQSRYSPENAQAARLRREGALGDLMSAEIRQLTTSVQLRNASSWVFQKQLAGGGMLHWLGCHSIDFLRYVTGQEIVEVAAVVGTTSGAPIDVEDVAALSLRLSGGAVATIHVGYVIQGRRPDYLDQTYDTYFGMRGTLGRVWTDDGPGDVTLKLQTMAPGYNHAKLHTYSYKLPQSEAYAGPYGMDFLRGFFTAALEGGRPPVTGEDGLKVLQVVEAAYRSSETGRTVKL